MKQLQGKSHTTNLTDFKLDALSTFWQFDQIILEKLESFIRQRFKYPKGGGWDLDSLRTDILEQNDLFEIEKLYTLLPEALAANQGGLPINSNAIQLINQELINRYKPNLSRLSDYQTIQNISQVIYAMEAVRLGILKPGIDKETLPSRIVNLLEN